MKHSPVIVFDFETTGMEPHSGDRPIEVGAVLVEEGQITDSFQSLMNPGGPISQVIESITGITNIMVEKAPPCAEVIGSFRTFVGDRPLVAHNLSFDINFLDTEYQRLRIARKNEVACTLLAARRIFPEVPDYKLSTLVAHLGIEKTGTFHRALADAEMTAHLWIAMTDYLTEHFALDPVEFMVMQQISKTPKAKVASFVEKAVVQQKQMKQAPRLF